MTVTYLASEGAAFAAGRALFWVGVPAIGLVCLVVGLVERSRSRRRPPTYPQYPPGFPVNPGYPYPPAYPAGPYPGYPGYAPRPRTPKSATTLITIGAVLLTLGGLGILGRTAQALSQRPQDVALAVGDCITENDYTTHHFEKHLIGGCANPANTYELAFKGAASDTCPDGKREHSIYERTSNHSTLLCFMINLRQDQCYQVTRDGEAVSMKPDDCNQSSPVHVRVGQRIDGSSDKTACPPDSKGIAYPVPARVYCMVRAD